MANGRFPEYRPRRLRGGESIRRLVRETEVGVGDLILPLFVVPGRGVRRPVGSMPGVDQTSIDELIRDAEEALRLGIPAVLLFGVPEAKDEVGSEGYADDGIVQEAVRALKREIPELVVITDVCLCEYTSHGHCGVIDGGTVVNDATLPLLARMAVSHAAAGADIVAPSDMMDGRVGRIRGALDQEGFADVPILSYSVKYASAFYGPFREAADSAPAFGDRRGYQMDGANAREALREASLDIEEGCDILMVKPALPYLDIIQSLRTETNYPVFGYQVSGEYAMIMAAAEQGWIDGDRAMREALTSIRRAGADAIVTYYARAFAKGAMR
jgi:porphobilinogen synthase